MRALAYARAVRTLPFFALVFAAACGGTGYVNETRMSMAPARPASCPIEYQQVDFTAVSFNETWEVLGYVSLGNPGSADPASPKVQAQVRPRACAMGGTVYTLALNSSTQGAFGGGTAMAFMVLRPKPQLAMLTATGPDPAPAPPPAPAAKPRTTAKLVYHAPPGCLTAGELADEVSARLGYSPWRPDAPLELTTQIAARGGGFHGTVGDGEFAKQIDGASCKVVTDAAASAIAVRLE